MTILFFLMHLIRPAQAQIERFSYLGHGIYRGGQPHTLDDYAMLKSYHIKTVLNFRMTQSGIEDEKKILDALDIQLIQEPFNGFTGVPEPFIQKNLDLIHDPKNHPIFVHCYSGKDRTGLMIGLYRTTHQKWNCQQAYEEMRAFDFNPFYLQLEAAFWKNCANPSLH
jgi:tyrosine-protein phosphatase SIW14